MTFFRFEFVVKRLCNQSFGQVLCSLKLSVSIKRNGAFQGFEIPFK